MMNSRCSAIEILFSSRLAVALGLMLGLLPELSRHPSATAFTASLTVRMSPYSFSCPCYAMRTPDVPCTSQLLLLVPY